MRDNFGGVATRTEAWLLGLWSFMGAPPAAVAIVGLLHGHRLAYVFAVAAVLAGGAGVLRRCGSWIAFYVLVAELGALGLLAVVLLFLGVTHAIPST